MERLRLGRAATVLDRRDVGLLDARDQSQLGLRHASVRSSLTDHVPEHLYIVLDMSRSTIPRSATSRLGVVS
jgi:hypothetical protein